MTNQEAAALIRRAQAEIEWDYPMEYAAAFDKAIEALEAAGWISVKDRLPEVGVDVLTASKAGYESFYMVDCIVNGDWWLQAGEEVLPVTHWMPLPEPPKEGESE